MATLLYRLGHFSFRHAWPVIIAWVLILGAIVGGAVALGGKTSESFVIPGTESQQTIDKLNALFPQVSGAAAQVVYVAPAGTNINDPANKLAITDMATAIEKVPQIAAVVPPFSQYAANAISTDGSTAYTQVQFTGPTTSIAKASIEDLLATKSIATADGMRVEFGGDIFANNTPALTATEGLGVVFAAVVLIITFGSLLAAGLPLLSALIGVGISIGGITAVASFATVSSTAPLLAVMIGLAVGIDYALFILSRHRNQLAAGMEPEKSAAQSVATAGGAVVFAGITVIIALLGLLVVGIPFLSTMGIASAFAVLVAVSIAITLLPAIMGLARRRLAPKAGSRAERRALAAMSHEDKASRSMGARWVGVVMRAPVVFIIAVVGLLGVAAIPAFSLDLNLPTSGQQAADTTNRQAYDLLAAGFGPGYNGPLVVAADITQTTNIMGDLKSIAAELRTVPGVSFVSEGLPDATVDTAIFRVIPDYAPDSPETKVVVQELRDLNQSMVAKFGTPITVTGQTAAAIDISNLLTGALVPFGTLVVGLSIILLAMVFRSVAVPLKAALGFLLSVGASFGVVVVVFQWGWFGDLLNVPTTGPVISFLPILLMAILFGLAMDYEVFLVSGMREEYVKTGDAKRSVRVGFQHGARVVTAAALIMFFVFFAFVPEGTGAIKQIGLALAVGVFIDAFLVRMTLVPAIMTLLGEKAWALPRWLDRILPNVDIEGEGLRDHLVASEWAGSRASDAITAQDARVSGVPTPLTFGIEAGSVAIIVGDTAPRRLFAATVAGRIAPDAGLLQVYGFSLPSEAGAVARSVTLVDLSLPRLDAATTLGEAIAERLSLARPWYRPRITRRAVSDVIDGLAVQVRRFGEREPLTSTTPLGALSPVAAALTLVALGAADGSPIVILDPGSAPAALETLALAEAAAALFPADCTVLVGVPDVSLLGYFEAPAFIGGRPALILDLFSGHIRGQAVTSAAGSSASASSAASRSAFSSDSESRTESIDSEGVTR